MTSNPQIDRNLHYAIIALKMDFIDHDQFVVAMNRWAADKSMSLKQLLLERGMLNPEDETLLGQMVAHHLDKYDGDVTVGLEAIASSSDLHQTIAQIADPDIEASVTQRGGLTLAFEVGSQSVSSDTGPVHVESSRPNRTGGNRFQVLRPHAKGGLGQVFIARDEEIGRQVALKEIQPQFVNNEALRKRFVLEAEINGNLEHPGIVPVYGLGISDDGHPYYAMRFIEGDTLKESVASFHRDAEGMDTTAYNFRLRQLLGRFVDVCDAMAYAHSRGVLHRDLKPANIMLGQFGETLIIDWGLAKPANEREPDSSNSDADSETTLVTPSGSVAQESVAGKAMGTPAFMSPEQAEGNIEVLGPRSDIYSLGATLYAILTNCAPIEGDNLEEMLERVRENIIVPPRIANPRVPAALEAICLKALALKPVDRYGSARQLADDIEHFLADEPVIARRDPFPTKVWRWIRKHRTLTATVAAALVVGIMALSYGWSRESQFANQLSVANQQLRESNESTKQAEQLADARLDLAMNSIEDYFTGVSEEALKGGQISKELRESLLARPRDFYTQLNAELSSKEKPSQRELELLAVGQLHLGSLLRLLGRANEALEQNRDAVTRYEALTKLQSDNLNYQRGLAESNNNLGVMLQTTGQLSEAIEAYQRGILIRERLVAEQRAPTDRDGLGRSLNNLGYLLYTSRRSDDAIAKYRRAIELRTDLIDEDPDLSKYRLSLGKSYLNMGVALRAIGNLADASESNSKAISTYESWLERDPENAAFQSGLLSSLGNRAILLRSTGKIDEGVAHFRRAIAIAETLVKKVPGVPRYRMELARIQANLAAVLRTQRQYDEVLTILEQAESHYNILIEQHPDVPEYQDGLAASFITKGQTLMALNRHEETLASYNRAIELQKSLATRYPDVANYHYYLVRSFSRLGSALQSTGELEKAIDVFRKSCSNYDELVQRHPDQPKYQSMAGASWNNLGNALVDQKEYEEAAECFRTAIEYQKPVFEAAPENRQFRRFLGLHYQNLAEMHRELGRPGESAREIRKLIELYPSEPSQLYKAACWLSLCVSVLEDASEQESEALAAEAVATLVRAIEAGWSDAEKISNDDDLEAIRDRADFQSALSGLESKGQ